jgi:hypothetical protein
VHDAHGVEGDVDAAGRRRDRIGVPFDRLLIEHINLRGLDPSARGCDTTRHGVELRLRPPGDEDPRAFPGEYPCDGATDSASAAIDYSVPVLKQQATHVSPPGDCPRPSTGRASKQ